MIVHAYTFVLHVVLLLGGRLGQKKKKKNVLVLPEAICTHLEFGVRRGNVHFFICATCRHDTTGSCFRPLSMASKLSASLARPCFQTDLYYFFLYLILTYLCRLTRDDRRLADISNRILAVLRLHSPLRIPWGRNNHKRDDSSVL